MGYCFMTFEKIKTRQQLSAKWRHNYREMQVSNADPSKKDLNEELVSMGEKTYLDAFNEKIKELGYDGKNKKIRKNGVLALEVITTFSRQDKEHIDLEQWKKDNVEWLEKTFNANKEAYGNNVISVVYHADEPGNVHCHAIVIPIDNKGCLNASYYVTKRQQVIEMQDSYAKAMVSHGLERGIKGSKANHKDIKRYYADLNSRIQAELPAAAFNESIIQYRKRANEVYKDAMLKNLALEEENERLKIENEQKIKNAVAAERKMAAEKYSEHERTLEDLERRFGNIKEIENKCRKFDLLIAGANEHEKKVDCFRFLQELIDNGKKVLKKRQKEKNIEYSENR